jgi:hypothetical protein
LSNSSIGWKAAGRAQWLAEVSASLAEASTILIELDLASHDPTLITSLYLQIETARVEARRLSASRYGEVEQNIFNWCGVSPWNLDASATRAHQERADRRVPAGPRSSLHPLHATDDC